jgi:hypothetical protein
MSDLLKIAGGKSLTPEERRRLERLTRTRQNRRGRKHPVAIPAELTRTSAFAPRRTGLVEDRNFQRVYVVTHRSVVEVAGRELGSQHRDALYAIFRLPSRALKVERLSEQAPALPGLGRAAGRQEVIVEAHGTWRDVLRLMHLTEHVNNLLTVLKNFEELRSVNLRVYKGSQEEYLRAVRAGRLPAAGFSDNFLGRIEWDGVSLDSRVLVRYGEWLRTVFEQRRLVSLNSQVYFELKSDHAKSFWPYIDGQPTHAWVDEATLGELVDRDPAAMSVDERRNFRENCRRAFADMVAAGGLESFRIETLGAGRRKSYRYHYVHRLPRQIELDLAAEAVAAALQVKA